MGTRTLASRPQTSGEIALNAYIHGFGGHSLVTPHAALKQLWWTDQRIEAKVSKRYVLSKLRGEEREFLNRPLAYGEGLTDNTYLDWILQRAKRLFLILSEIGCSDQIFGCVDDSWSDDDLPIAWEDVESLELSYNNDQALNRRFWKIQYTFLLRPLHPDTHIEYGPQEHIPIEYVNTLPPAVVLQSWERIHFPEQPDKVFVRRKFPFEDGVDDVNRKAFLRDVRRAQHLPHEHIAPVWATYVSSGAGYALSNFVAEHTLQTFVDHRTPMQLMRVPAERRPVLLCEWMHCLADAVAYLHHNRLAHGSIKPSNIVIDHDNKIAFADIGTLRTFQRAKKIVKNETHNYAAPESQRGLLARPLAPPSPSKRGMFRLSRLRKLSISTTSSSSSEGSSGCDSGYASTNVSRPTSTLPHLSKEDTMSILSTAVDAWSLASAPAMRHIPVMHDSTPSFRSLPAIIGKASVIDPSTLRDLPAVKPEMTDIYSLGCIFLDIVTFVMRGKLNDFVKYRTSKINGPDGRSVADTSFVMNSEKVDEWMEMLEEESHQYAESIYRGIPDIIGLVRSMLRQNASTRPSACQVRDRICDILVLTCGVDRLCCAERVWSLPVVPIEQSSPTGTHPAVRG